MKLKNKLRFGSIAATLAAPIIALPLINAVKISTSTTDLAPTNLADLTVNITEKSTYTVRFKQKAEKGIVASVVKMHIDDHDDIDILKIPATVTAEDRNSYPLMYLDCDQGCSGFGVIRCIDLSEAINLVEICNSCFGEISFKIGFVNFKGAKNLETIAAEAFSRQYFNSDYKVNHNIIDLTETKLKTIGEEAFYKCCDTDKNVFNAIIFPATIQKIAKNSFSTDGNERCRIHFHKVIFTDPDPQKGLFEDGIPRVADKNALGIIVPYGSEDKYKNLPHFDRTYSKNIYESTIHYDYSSSYSASGMLKITDLADRHGMDPTDWFPITRTLRKQTDVYLWLSDTHDSRITIDAQGHINWSNNLKPGEYVTRVYGIKYDDTEGKLLSVVASKEIHISIIRAKLVDGTSHITLQPGETFTDTAQWRVDISPEGSPRQIRDVDWRVTSISDQLKGKVEVEKEGLTGKISITQPITEKGTFGFALCALVQDRWAENKFKVYQQVYVSVGDFGVIGVEYNLDGGSNYEQYNGQELKLSGNQKAWFRLNQPTFISGATPSSPELSIDGITLTPTGQDTYTFVFDPTKFDTGYYQFDAHCTVTDIESNKFDIYSATDIKISVNQDVSIVNDLPNEIDIVKTRAGSYSYKLLKGNEWKIDDIVPNPASWHKDDTRIDKLISFAVDPNDNKSLTVTWSDTYSPLGKSYDDLDVMLDITIKNTTTNETRKVHQAVSILATNTSEIVYESETPKIDVVPGQTTTTDAFIFKLNGAISGYNNATWDCYCEDATLKSCIKINPPETKTSDYAYLTIDDTQKKLTTKGVYDVTVYAVDKENLTASFITLQVNVDFKVTILDVPSTIETYNGAPGKTDKPLITLLGTEEQSNPTYTISGLGDKVWVDDEGYINWKADVPAGIHQLCVTSTIKVGNESYSGSVWIAMNVTETGTHTNTAAIVGGSVGGAVVVGGAATGITLGVKKHKLPKGKKK